MHLIRPARAHLPSYADALRRGYSDEAESPAEILEKLERSPEELFARFDNPQATVGPLRLPDGSFVARLPGIIRWMWDGEFGGSISLRWQNGTTDLPPTCLGHIGYSVVPWKRRLGYATAALAQMLPQARERGLPFVDIVTNLDNVASQRVIIANGGVLAGQFEKPVARGGGPALRFRIAL